MQRDILGLAIRPSKNSVCLVQRTVEGLIKAYEAGSARPTDIHLLHVAITFGEGDQRLTKEIIAFISKRLHPHLQLLPPHCTWHVHILTLRRPVMQVTASDIEQMTAYALCRKAARLNCTELLIKGKGPDPRLLPYLIGHSITHLVLQWSTIPVHLYHPKLGFKLEEPRAVIPRGQDVGTWRASLCPQHLAPVLDGTVVEQPDGALVAVYCPDLLSSC